MINEEEKNNAPEEASGADSNNQDHSAYMPKEEPTDNSASVEPEKVESENPTPAAGNYGLSLIHI